MKIPKKLKYTIVIFVVIVIVGFILFESACRNRMVKRSAFSIDIEMSIEEGFYIRGYLPLHSTYASPNRLDSIIFDSAWIEHSYKLERPAGLCLCEHKIKGESYNFCAPFTATRPYIFKLEYLHSKNDTFYDLGSFLGNRFNFGLNAIQDTLKIQLTYNSTLDTLSERSLDTVYFVKKENGR